MKNRAILLIAAFVLFSSGPVFADTSIQAEVDKTKLTTDQSLIYKVTVISSDKPVSLPEFPKFTGFNVNSQIQSTQVSFVNGEAKSTFIYSVVLSPTVTGKLKIAPSHIKIKGSVVDTKSFDIGITQGKKEIIPSDTPSEPENGAYPDFGQPKVTL